MNSDAAGTFDFGAFVRDRDSRARAALSALADRDRGAIADLIRYERTIGQPAWDGEPRGLLLLGGRGDAAFDDDNPWGVRAGSGLSGALRLIWAPVADRCPDFVATVLRETLALALVRETGGYLLGYLFLDRLDEPAAPPGDLDELREVGTDSAWLAWMWGGPPVHHDTIRHVGVLGRPVPAPLRDLARIHSSLTGQDGSIHCRSFDETLGGRLRGHGEQHPDAERIDAGVYDRYVHLGDWGPGAESNYLNLDTTDSSGDPCVATYNGQDHSINGRQAFWDWFNRCGPVYLFQNEDSL